MARASKRKGVKIKGERVGTKKRDMRWIVDGVTWASRFEYIVFTTLQQAGLNVRKTGPEDSLAYASPVRSARCLQCGSESCVTERTYTPDIHAGPAGSTMGHEDSALRARSAQAGFYYVEAKGYLRADRRALLRSVRKAWPGIDFRLIIQRDYRVTSKLTLVQWAEKYLKGVKVVVWNGKVPEGWT